MHANACRLQIAKTLKRRARVDDAAGSAADCAAAADFAAASATAAGDFFLPATQGLGAGAGASDGAALGDGVLDESVGASVFFFSSPLSL